MPAIAATAPGKIILFGEHAVVYGQPAIAVPLMNLQARAAVFADLKGSPGQIRIEAPAINLVTTLADLAPDHPIGLAIRLALQAAQVETPPACTLRITSSIPVASGLGSGAAVSVAIIRAISAFLGRPVTDLEVNSMVFEVEKLYHGNPSGIDNTVITYAQPVYFQRESSIEILHLAKPLTFVVGDTGIPFPTVDAVGAVRAGYNQNPSRYNQLFEQIGKVTRLARNIIEKAVEVEIGALMNENHTLLQSIDVSSPELDQLVQAAQGAGAYGAKLSGAGMGGNIVALTSPETSDHLSKAILAAGATRTMITTVRPSLKSHSPDQDINRT